MKAAFPCIVALAVLALPAVAADQPITWIVGTPHCTQEYLDGKQIRTIEHDGLRVSVGVFHTAKDALAAQIYVINDGIVPVDVLPDQIFITATPGNSDRPALVGTLPIDELIAGANRDARLKAGLAQFAAGFQTTTATTFSTTTGTVSVAKPGALATATGTFGATTVATTTSPDWGARLVASYRTMQIYAMARDEVSAIQADALRANTVRPGGAIGGIVWIGRHKYFGRNDTTIVLNIRLADHTFQFPEGTR